MSNKYQELLLDLNNLIVNKNNYRHEPLSSEQEAIERFCLKSESKLLKLADSISKHGVFPTTTFIVYKNSENKYVALDGNRRLTAIKVINNPTLVPFASKAVRAWATSHKQDFSTLKIRCIEYYNEEDAGPEIYDIHSGQSQTNEKWTKTAQIRYDKKYLGIDEPLWFQVVEKNAPDFLESLEETDSLSTIERIITKSNLDTYMPIDTDFRLINSNGTNLDALKQILIDAIADKINTRTLNAKVDQVNYLNDIFNITPTNPQPSAASSTTPPTTTTTPPTTTTTPTTNPPRTTRTTNPVRIDSFQIRKIRCINPKAAASEYSGILRILSEINLLYKKFKGNYWYESLPLSTLYLVRSLLEQSLKLFLKEYHVSVYNSVTSNGSRDAQLSDMISKINNLIRNKPSGTNIFDVNVDREFVAHFDRPRASYHENLNIIIHKPHTYVGNIQMVHDYTQGVTYDVIEYILMKLR